MEYQKGNVHIKGPDWPVFFILLLKIAGGIFIAYTTIAHHKDLLDSVGKIITAIKN